MSFFFRFYASTLAIVIFSLFRYRKLNRDEKCVSARHVTEYTEYFAAFVVFCITQLNIFLFQSSS